ncbi:substrate-binding and VWA domain-containing protein [Micromonospora peucetia]|uniref:Substrate-binding and VWA domain-containing protein n=2 Tax=Micromonospora peucetia TaxID=47871 RepID=A0ABZ1E8G3_9ACTN|nr:substrate-binding domain-containing protein [Micromonospora peucetia]MCX4389847.1 substrate-binding and VWA domain-containing protein [Micromonospora peucetia]WSA30312.1 substrate-binding and VWA domain-containing protein [Micromonospora peucetia]
MSAGRHRMRRSIHAATAAAAVGVLAVTAGGWFGYQQLAQPDCSGRVELSVAVAGELAPAIDAAAAEWVKGGAAVGGTCIAVNVSASDPVDVAATVAAKHGATLAGVGQASGTSVSPDVWVPDSSMWLLRLKTGGATAFEPGNGASVARSPVVVAMPEPIATRLGWPQKKFSWTELLQQVQSDKPLRTGIVEPTRDAAGLSGLLSLTAAASATGGPDAEKEKVAALRALATDRSALRPDLLARFPTASDPTTIASSLGAAALSEEDVIQYNSKKPPVPLAALYLEPAPAPLDYPYAVLPGIEPAKASAARVLYEVLTTDGFRDRLASHSLRAPNGDWGAGFDAPQGAPSPAGGVPAPPANGGGSAPAGLDPQSMDRAVSSWSIATQSGRMLAVIDVSGSMKEKVANAGNATRQQVTVEAARRGLNLFDDSWSIGLWTFSTELVGSRDHRELVAIGPLSRQRGRLEQALGSIRSSSGSTGLYDTVLAAYQQVQDNWEPGRVNSIVLFTDGKNEDRNGITQQKLLGELDKIKDPERPVQVVIIGIGGDVSKAELKSITDVTGGGAFVTEDPTKIGDIFLNAIALRKAPA